MRAVFRANRETAQYSQSEQTRHSIAIAMKFQFNEIKPNPFRRKENILQT